MQIGFKKGQMTLEGGVSNAIMFGVLVISVGIVATILASIQSGQTAASYAYNISGYGLTGLANLGAQFGNVGTVLAAALILTILIVGLGFLVFKK